MANISTTHEETKNTMTNVLVARWSWRGKGDEKYFSDPMFGTRGEEL
jgi:hypothetical protein